MSSEDGDNISIEEVSAEEIEMTKDEAEDSKTPLPMTTTTQDIKAEVDAGDNDTKEEKEEEEEEEEEDGDKTGEVVVVINQEEEEKKEEKEKETSSSSSKDDPQQEKKEESQESTAAPSGDKSREGSQEPTIDDKDKKEEDDVIEIPRNPPPTASNSSIILPSMAAYTDDEDSDEEDEDDIDETILERLVGLTEMFPESLVNGTSSFFHGSIGLTKWAYSAGRSLTFIAFSSAAIMFLPIIIESERLEMAEQEKLHQRQILLGPGAAVSGAAGLGGAPPIPSA